MAAEDLWSLFALNVLHDFLVLPLRVSRSEHRRFFEALGLEIFEPHGVFNPLFGDGDYDVTPGNPDTATFDIGDRLKPDPSWRCIAH